MKTTKILLFWTANITVIAFGVSQGWHKVFPLPGLFGFTVAGLFVFGRWLWNKARYKLECRRIANEISFTPRTDLRRQAWADATDDVREAMDKNIYGR